MVKKMLVSLGLIIFLVSLRALPQSFTEKPVSAQNNEYATHYGGFFSLDYPSDWATTEIETLDANLVLFSPEDIHYVGEPTFHNMVNDEALQAALIDRPVAGLWIVRIQHNDLTFTLRDEMEMPLEWVGRSPREVVGSGLSTLKIYKSEYQRESSIGGYEAVEALGVLQGQGRFAEARFGVYTNIFRNDEYLFWFTGVAVDDEFRTVQADFEYMAHTISLRADDVNAEDLAPPDNMEFASIEGTGYTLDYPATWSTDTSENFDRAWFVTSPTDIFLQGDPADAEIITMNEDILQAMPHSPIAGMVRLELGEDILLQRFYLEDLLEDMATQVTVQDILMQRHTRVNGAEAIEVSVIVQGAGQFTGQNFGVYNLVAKTNVAIYYFVGVAPETDFEIYEPVFRYMGHRIEFHGVLSSSTSIGTDTSTHDAPAHISPTNTEFAVYAGIPHDVSIVQPAWEVEADSTVAEGVVRGVLEDGTPFIGSLDAPIVFAEFSDFACPHCAQFEPDLQYLIKTYVRTGQLRIEFRPLTFVGQSLSITAAKGSLCAAQQGAFWEFHTLLFALQHDKGATNFTNQTMLDLGTELGLDSNALQSCMDSTQPDITLTAATELQIANGVNGTPTIIYRANNAEEWQRLYDGNGNITHILSFEALGQIINAYNN